LGDCVPLYTLSRSQVREGLRTTRRSFEIAGELPQIRNRDLGYGGSMKPNQVVGVVLILAGVVCFWMESADKSQANWMIDVLGIILALLGLWVGKFNFKKNQGKTDA
jgi:prolipoprotein diacylglyceryltransferase